MVGSRNGLIVSPQADFCAIAACHFRCDRRASVARALMRRGKLKTPNLICLTALPLLLCISAAASAQTETRPVAADGQAAPPAAPAAPGDEGERQVAFSANQLTYDSNSELVTASGDV